MNKPKLYKDEEWKAYKNQLKKERKGRKQKRHLKETGWAEVMDTMREECNV